MFAKYVVHVICSSCEEVNARIFFDEAMLAEPFSGLICACVRSIRIPPLAELVASLQPRKIAVTNGPPAFADTFAFFPSISKIFDQAAIHALSMHEDDDEDDWEAIVDDACRYVHNMDESVALPESVTHMLESPEEAIWQRYLTHYVSWLYPMPGLSVQPLQHKVLHAWLLAHECVAGSTSKIAAIHVVARWYMAMLRKLASSIDPLASLDPARDIGEKLVSTMDGSEDVDVGLNEVVFTAFYDLMVKQVDVDGSSNDSLLKWADALGVAEIPTRTRGVDMKRLDAMQIVQAAIQSIDRTKFESHEHDIQHLIRKVDALVKDARPGETRLCISHICGCFGALKSLSSNATLTYRVLELCMERASTTDDLHTLIEMSKRVPMLEMLLLGNGQKAELVALGKIVESDGLIKWLEFPDNERHEERLSRLIDRDLRNCEASCDQPPWFGRDASASTIAETFFYLVWKWLVLRYSEASPLELAQLANRLADRACTRAPNPFQCKVSAAATRVHFIMQLAHGVVNAHGNSGAFYSQEDLDCIVIQLECMGATDEDRELWSRELSASLVCACSGDAQRARQIIALRATQEDDNGNGLAADWLRLALRNLGDS